MEVLGAAVLSVFFFLAVFGLFFNFLGTFWLLAGAFTYAWITGFTVLGVPDILFLGLLYAAGELMDWIAIGFAVKKSGASKSAVWGSIAGGFIGAFIGVFAAGIGAVPGLLIGAFSGAFLFQWFANGDLRRSLKAGAGSSLGYLVSWVFKILIACGMTAWMGFRIFWFYAHAQV